MTIVAAVKTKDGIWLGADCQGTDATEKIILKNPKVFQKGGFTFAFSGSYRFGQVLQYVFQPPERMVAEPAETYLLTRWMDALRQCLNDAGLLKVENSLQDAPDCFALVAYEDFIFMIQEDLSVLFPADPFVASGSGSAYAIGALNAAPVLGRKALERAIRAAIKSNPGCGGEPLIVRHL